MYVCDYIRVYIGHETRKGIKRREEELLQEGGSESCGGIHAIRK